MIKGFFDANGRPRVQALVSLHSFVDVNWVTFLVDTGADLTILHPRDAALLEIPLSKLEYSESLGGIGGGMSYSPQVCDLLFFRDAPNLRLHDWRRFSIAVAQPTAHNLSLPSLLGRDILEKWRMNYDRPANILEFDPGDRR